MRKRHVIYISGLGDGFDSIRKLGLLFWRSRRVVATHIPMRWSDPNETYEQKMTRIMDAAVRYPDYDVVFIGESAGGPMAIAALRNTKDATAKAVTLCGMNQGAGSVGAALYRRNPAFKATMTEVDRIIPSLSEQEKNALMTVYSSGDKLVRPHDTLLDGVRAHDIKVPQHNLAILTVLFWWHRQMLKMI